MDIDKEVHQIIKIFSKKNINYIIPGNIKKQNQIYKKSGNSFELKNIREYQLTDDFRKIDWKLYGRTERFYIKEYFDQENLPIYFLIDCSASIKLFDLNYYLTFILSLSYIFLKLDFTLNMVLFNNKIIKYITQLKGVNSISKIFSFLSKISFKDYSNFNNSIKQLKTKFNSKIVFIFSDFLFKQDYFNLFSNYKKTFLIHFYNKFKNFNFEFNTLLVKDEELSKTITFPLNNITEKVILDLEKKFLSKIINKSKEKHLKYFFIESNKIRYNYYFNIMVEFYG